ncbi:PDZ domain-containing protein [Myroides albus]|uniref:PDZ domain-containing protein n=1 Tax=Myroides albus TaxID=2562892 RepID=UPI0021592F9C|nr:PDZ domain-containing protein [Myroides albus]UVD79671.1 PDZ domain-containing protein [Myroides albus]
MSIVLDDLSRLTALYEKKFDGIIGATILDRYLTKIDFGTQTMSLYEFGTALDYSAYQKLPIEFYGGNIPKLPIVFELSNGDKFEGDILFDSGAGVTLIVNRPYKEQHQLYDKLEQKITYTGNNLSNKTFYEKGIIKNIQLGDYKIEKSDMAISLSSDEAGVSAAEGIVGIMGSEIIHRFDLILDYNSKVIYIKPNQLFSKEFKPLINPISFKYSSDRSQIMIASIIETTDAYKKGLREGDIILAIDGFTSNDFSDYEKILRKENTKVKVKYIDSNGKVKTVKLSLTRIL